MRFSGGHGSGNRPVFRLGFWDVSLCSIDFSAAQEYVSLFVEVFSGFLINHVEVLLIDQHGLQV